MKYTISDLSKTVVPSLEASLIKNSASGDVLVCVAGQSVISVTIADLINYINNQELKKQSDENIDKGREPKSNESDHIQAEKSD